MDELKSLLTSTERQQIEQIANSRNHSSLIIAHNNAKLNLAEAFLADFCQRRKYYFILTTPDETGSIKIEVTRQIIEKSITTTNQKRWFVIRHAETMTREAQNSLLKLLEEPNQDIYLILLSSQPSRLLATIRSRTQLIKLSPVKKSTLATLLRSNFPKLDSKQLSQLLFLAQNDLQLLLDLAKNDELSNRYIKIATDARKIITADQTHALIILTKYFNSREEAIILVGTLLKIHHSLIVKQLSTVQISKLTPWLTALKRLQQNCSVRLTLINAII
ncbi:MAG: hypothetical protein Q3996_02935 [Candidatus Saccharibacteria bacterium]|nr:hypothetical protein [Candidatus Saccharibacteria bacterium]